MKRFFLYSFFFLLSSSYCFGQDTIACKNGKKIVGKVVSIGKEKVIYTVPPDSNQIFISTWRLNYISYPGGTRFNFTEKRKNKMPSETSLYLSADAGSSVPAANYKDGIVGTHFGAKATYYVSHNVGIMAKAALDLNGTGLYYTSSDYWGGFYIFQQYLAGISYRTGGKPGFPWIDFVGLGGIANAANPVSEQGGGYNPLTVYNPGHGTGIAYYFGIDFTSSADHTCSLTFGAGCLGASFKYPNYVSTVSTHDPYTGVTTNTTSNSVAQKGLALFQVYLGINFRMKKAQR